MSIQTEKQSKDTQSFNGKENGQTVLLGLTLSWFQFFDARAQENVRLFRWIVVFMAFAPVITNGISKNITA